jgi:aminobutyraldehyde dehydrogenase
MLQDEMPAASDCFRFFAGAVRNMQGAVAAEYMAGHTSMIRRDPIGVIGSIARSLRRSPAEIPSSSSRRNRRR